MKGEIAGKLELVFTILLKAASLKSVLLVVIVTSKVLNRPAMSEIPRCITLKVNLECNGSTFHDVYANACVHNKTTAKIENIFFIIYFTFNQSLCYALCFIKKLLSLKAGN